jgi:16S rRNA G527 N7-methylase RsmG
MTCAFALHLGPLLKSGDRIVEMGAGSGILAFVCGLAFPHVHFTLVDNRRACCDFLSKTIVEQHFANLEVIHSRGEVVARDPRFRHQYAGVMARRFSGGAAKTAEICAPLLHRDGFILVSDPAAEVQSREQRWPANGLTMLGLAVEKQFDHATVLRANVQCSHSFPRSNRLKQRLF